jgi:hypothetical protein
VLRRYSPTASAAKSRRKRSQTCGWRSLTLIVVPGCSRHHAERAVVDEFFIRTEAKLAHVADAADVLRSARERLDELFPVRN